MLIFLNYGHNGLRKKSRKFDLKGEICEFYINIGNLSLISR